MLQNASIVASSEPGKCYIYMEVLASSLVTSIESIADPGVLTAISHDLSCMICKICIHL